MKQQSSAGTCALCEGTFSRTAMGRHLKGCAAQGDQKPNALHLMVEGRYARDYWLHLAVPASSSLDQLDGFLRRIWLECCGHMSAFTVSGEDPGMSRKISGVLEPGAKFGYEYDFGSTTELAGKVVGGWFVEGKRPGIKLLARNRPPEYPCDGCGARAATTICSSCACSGDGWLCDRCAKKHKCGEDYFLPVVNSPRAGVCGYTG